jgi:hypothetical protein
VGRPSACTLELHACERNSCLAAGYAEQFGYRARRSGSIAPHSAESDLEWRVRVGAPHPGYPACPDPSTASLFPRKLLGRFGAATDELGAPGADPVRLHPLSH